MEINEEGGMRPLLLALSAVMLLTLAGWGQTPSSQDAHASAAAHREAKKNAKHHHQPRRHRRHRQHTGA
jgi:hypothetical protein